MAVIALKDLRVGKVDGKHEYLTPASQRDQRFFDAFLLPDTVEPDRLHNGDMFFLEGFRGTGKTSLLRWHAEQKRAKSDHTEIVLFKSDLTEAQRLHISKEVGISWSDVDPKSMEISQDFKSAWEWFIFHKIGESLQNAEIASSDEQRKIEKLLGLNQDNVFQKAIGFMPKLEGASVKIKADVAFFEAELGGDFTRNGDQGKTTLDALNRRLRKLFSKLNLQKEFYIYFDELEVFHHSEEQHRRDQRMVRDLLFSIATLNEHFKIHGKPIHIIGAIRSEVLDSMGALGQEVDRLVHDRGFIISWHHAKRSINHPLLQIVSRKIQASESALGFPESPHPIEAYFPRMIDEFEIDAFLLDKSFYKPRDIVWRLSIAQKLFPHATSFTKQVLLETETEYSSKLWDEVRYELSATYSSTDIDVVEAILSGASDAFTVEDIDQRFSHLQKKSPNAAKLAARVSTEEILNDLYRLGAVGNSFRAGPAGTDIRNRWSFRGDPTLLIDKRIVLHPALLKRLSAVATRRRGKRGGRMQGRGQRGPRAT